MNRFAKLADWVSEAMGSPTNIGLWALAVGIWFWVFAIDPNLQNSNFLPSWFTSQAFNFPLNTVTTLAELFIGFLIAAAANRVEKRNYELHLQMKEMLQQMLKLTTKEEKEIQRIVRKRGRPTKHV